MGDQLVANHSQLLAMASSRSSAHLIGDAMIPYIPRFLIRAAIQLPSKGFRVIRNAKTLTLELGTRLVNERLGALQEGLELNDDIYSSLLQAGERGKNKNAMTGSEIAAQTSLLLLAGQDTTANTLAWGLRELAAHPEFQDELRNEVHAMLGRTAGTNIAYDSMPLLNAFIKETLRMYPVVPLSEQIATQDTYLPLTNHVTTSSGEKLKVLPIRKGQIVNLAIASYQRLESLWGPDANEWKPSRWIEGTTYKGDALGPYSNLLSFFGGPRACLGWRFA
ncbi:cytochrome P450 [Mycena rebaudengoi]|nr:cytochrome P450 [Mycena rebaudengoi]